MPNVPVEEVLEPSCVGKARAQQAYEGEGGSGAVSNVVVLLDPPMGLVINVPQPTPPLKMYCTYSRWVVSGFEHHFLNEMLKIFKVD